MDYISIHRQQIANEALDPAIAEPGDTAILSECADAIMDGCAAELMGCDQSRLDPQCRARVAAVIAACRGEVLPASVSRELAHPTRVKA